MSGPGAPIIIIRRKKKGGDGGHHGGAWKVAYADFVTAMMAFFLLLWLLNVTTDVERKGIADYFAPASMSKSESGAGGALGGQTVTVEGGAMGYSSPPAVEERTIATAGLGDEGDQDNPGKAESGAGDAGGSGEGTSIAANTDQQNGPERLSDEVKEKSVDAKVVEAAIKKREAEEEARFRAAEDALKQAIGQSPELRDLADQLLIESTPEGLRIQIVDKDNYSMFPSGSAILFEKSLQLLTLVGTVVARLPNEIVVSGHTDAKPFAINSRRDNWSLSTERANVSREALMKAGVPNMRVARVVGMADREPLDKADMLSAKNRRISIVLLRQDFRGKKLPPATAPAAPAAALPAPPATVPAPVFEAPRGAGTALPTTVRSVPTIAQ